MRLSEMQKTSKEKPKFENKKIEEEYEDLKDCSADDLMQKLAEEVKKQKINGEFDYEALKNSIEQIKIYLPSQTYENMLRIVESLK